MIDVESLLKQGVNEIRRLRQWRHLHAVHQQRNDTELLLADIARTASPLVRGNILVDGTWDNPHYWVRYSLFRAALGLAHANEVGFLGEYRRRECGRSFANLGIQEVFKIQGFSPDKKKTLEIAHALLDASTRPEDVLKWKLPFDFPASFLYDSIQKRQRTASIDLEHPRILQDIAEAIGNLHAADRLLSSKDFTLIALSHAINFTCGAVAWRAAQMGIPSFVLFGMYGAQRFWRINTTADFFRQADAPRKGDLDGLSAEQSDHLASVGREYLTRRRHGLASDIGTDYAYRRATGDISRAKLADMMDWDTDKPIVAVFTPTWFDFLHSFGMSNFRDGEDWLNRIIDVAKEVDSVNWLIRPHPLETWYQGQGLNTLMPTVSCAHIRVAPKEWNGAAVQAAADAFVTIHGTIGIEATAIGKPVLVADRGWYHEHGFVKVPESREEFLEMLATDWWTGMDLASNALKAEIFSGWFFGAPAWQQTFLLEDDSGQNGLYKDLPSKITAARTGGLQTEIHTIRDWHLSNTPYYQSFKIREAGLKNLICLC